MAIEPEDPWPFLRELDLSSGQVLSVTKILQRSGMVRWFIPPQHLQELAMVGRDIHMACEDVARGNVPDYWSDLEHIAGYVRGFEKFCKDYDYRAILIEHTVNHPMGYRGRLDTAGLLFANSRSKRRSAVIDIKKGVPAISHQFQLAAYAEGVRIEHIAEFGKTLDRICVYLDASGSYAVRRFDNPLDFANFTALLTTAKMRTAAGLISERDEREFDNLLRYAADPAAEWEPRL